MSDSTHLDATAPEPGTGKVSIEQQPATHAARKRIVELEAEVARLRRERAAAIDRAAKAEAAPTKRLGK